MNPPPMEIPERRKSIILTEEHYDEIAERTATKLSNDETFIEKVGDSLRTWIYAFVGRAVLTKFLYVGGAILLALYAFLKGAGKV